MSSARNLLALLAIVLLCAGSCAPQPPAPLPGRLQLSNPNFGLINVEAVITTSPNCDNRDAYVSTQEFVMTKNRTQRIEAPKAENICWRHDSNPNNPVAGAWTGWSRATMFPGQTYETDL